ncbi:MAG: SufD family Fe-S cluster assembly protein [Clostridia bacterium]|nr:SufD family Fe-S cluster assembly protein [Clostridia bacterium]
MALDTIQKNLLKEVADLESIPEGAYNIRSNGKTLSRNVTANIDIVQKTDKPGIDIIVKKSEKRERVDIPVIITETGIKDLVYNDFYIEDGADVIIVAGCGIHSVHDGDTSHDGIHSFHVGKNAKVLYYEKHYGSGDGNGKKLMNPTTVVEIDEGGSMTMETAQIKGVDSTVRKTTATLGANATLIIHEKIMTHGEQYAETDFNVDINGDGANVHVVSRAVAKDNSVQKFYSVVNGNCACSGRTECDAIVMDKAKVLALPGLNANSVDASLVHEAAIGKIAGEQLIKLMTLGLTEQEAEEQIVNGFLK